MLSSQGLKDKYVLIRTNKETIFSKKELLLHFISECFLLGCSFHFSRGTKLSISGLLVWRTPITAPSLGDVSNI
ncbi:hypothetical protein HanIR_Chr12g0587481 [Helianthus annuus]|nr:hypothetical protein HanIR_Chr12g0587481 [Helianthus annuus]